MENTQKQTCERCRYWNYSQLNKLDNERSQCRRFPPTFRGGYPSLWHAAFPETQKDEWCGRFRRRKEVKKIEQKRPSKKATRRKSA
jgi:hypothetical protein